MSQFAMSPEQTVLCHQMARLAGVGGFVLDLDAGVCLWCSDEVARMHGLAPAACGGLLVGDERARSWIHDDDRDHYRDMLARARRERTPYAIEYRLRSAGDRSTWLHETGDFVIDPDSGGQRQVGTIRDVTLEREAQDRLRRANEALEARVAARTAELEGAKDAALSAEQEAKASHDRLRAAAESLIDGIAIFDDDDRLVFFNSHYPDHAPPAFRVLIRLGERFEDLIRAAHRSGGMYHPEMGEAFVERRLADRREPSESREFRIADGRWVRVRESAIPGGGRVLLTSDVTERRAATAALADREQRWRAIAEGVVLPLVIARIDAPEILFANAPMRALFGLAEGVQPEAIRAAYVRSADRAGLIERLGRGERVDALEVELRRIDGSTMWALLSARVIPFDGAPAMLAAVTDITGRKAAEGALQASEARLAAIMEHAPVAIYVKDLRGRYELANPEMVKLFRRPVAEAIGRTADDVFPGPLAARIAEYDRRLLETGRQSVYERHLPERQDYAWAMVIRFPIRDAEGRITHIGGFDLDITERKSIEEALRQSEQRFKVFAEAHPVPVVISCLERGILFASPPFLELFETSHEALTRGDLGRFYVDPTMRQEVLERVQRDGQVRSLEIQLKRSDGTPFWGVFNSRLIEYQGKPAVVSSVVDISERKRAEAELERQRQMLHQNEKLSALGSLLAGVAHELNNPLSVVVGHATLLEELTEDPATRERAARIRNAADRCARIVRTFLAMARSKPKARSAVDLNTTLEAALDIVAYGLRTADIRVIRALAPDLPAVWADGDQLHQVFANLLVNAQQALQGVPGPRQLWVATDRDGDWVQAEVTDNGPGIPPETLPRIFDPFFTTKPQGIGTGVGLSVCHGIVTAHDGEITCESMPGSGARFRVRLPRSTAPEPARAKRPDRQRLRQGRILVVDDEPEVGELLTDILERDGHDVVRALSGREALARLAEREADLIISDLRMPDMDGPALYQELVRTRPAQAARVVFVTGDTLGADMTGFLTETSAQVIEKPLDPGGVSRRVQILLTELAQAAEGTG